MKWNWLLAIASKLAAQIPGAILLSGRENQCFSRFLRAMLYY
jgi:hypothetical protein